MSTPLFALFVGMLLLSGCVSNTTSNTTNSPGEIQTHSELRGGLRVEFQSEDGLTLVGTLWKNPNSNLPPVVLVHQLSRDRFSFHPLALELFDAGYTVLAFDLRGNGESTRQGGTNVSFLDFSETDYKLMTSDIWSAKKFLNSEKIMVVGASIGANAALVYASEDISSPGIVLLSPGANYHGIDITEASKQKRVPMLVVASTEDTYSAASAQNIFTSGPLIDKRLIMLEDAGHGTDMLLRSTDLTETIVAWLNEHSGVSP